MDGEVNKWIEQIVMNDSNMISDVARHVSKVFLQVVNHERLCCVAT